jgi:hypothetical protein
LSVLNFNLLLAVRTPGFIVTNKSDTITGEIKIPIFDSYTGGLSLFGINLEQFIFSGILWSVSCKTHTVLNLEPLLKMDKILPMQWYWFSDGFPDKIGICLFRLPFQVMDELLLSFFILALAIV